MLSFVWYAFAAFVLYRLYLIIFNLFIHPLKKIPGPALYAVSWIPRTWRDCVQGKHWSDLVKLHEKYGDIVRTGPDEVSCISSKSWNDIAGFKTGGREEFQRDSTFLTVLQLGGDTITSTDKFQHRFFRRLLSPGFSEKALAAQEPIMVEWGDKFVENVRSHAGQPIDMALTFTWAALDLMSDLVFGEPFDCLEKDKSPDWLVGTMAGEAGLGIFQVIIRFDMLIFFFKVFSRIVMRLPIIQRWLQSLDLGEEKGMNRIDRQTEGKPDVMSLIWDDAQEEKNPVTREQRYTILVAPDTHAYERLVKEIRSLEGDNLIPGALASLPYFNCCIQEGLRLHSPVTGMIPRVVPKGGDWVDGYFLPEGTLCGNPHWAAGNSLRNFSEPTKYLPERWLSEDSPRFAKDNREGIQSFGKGSTACIGKQLAMTEMRLYLGKLLWHFDFQLQPETNGWVAHPDAVCRLFREKAPLMVTPKPVVRGGDFVGIEKKAAMATVGA